MLRTNLLFCDKYFNIEKICAILVKFISQEYIFVQKNKKLEAKK